jgi:hypothetical protein
LYSIGIRVSVGKKMEKGTIFFSILKLNQNNEVTIIKNSCLKIPLALDVPEQLAFIRTNFHALITQYDIKLAGLRIVEHTAQSHIILRTHIEGVLQELFANSSVEKYALLNIPKMIGALGMQKDELKGCMQGDDLLGIEDWGSMKTEERECVLTATTMLNKEVADIVNG